MIFFDFETKSYADLKKVGAWAYSEHPTTDVICACWAIDDGPVERWVPTATPWGHKLPNDLFKALLEGHEIEAHNVAFERSIWENVMVPRYGWMLPDDDQWRDSMAAACYLALPPALDALARALKMGNKNPEGGRLITKYSKLHLKTAKLVIPQEDLDKFVEYCADDVRLERSISNYLGDLPERELEVFQLDQEINRRGIHLDTAGIDVASIVVMDRSETLAAEFKKITGFNHGQRDRVLMWFAMNGLVLENMQKGYLQDLMEEGEIPSGPLRRALEIRLEINKASTKKLDAMARNCGKDGRAHFQTRYHGAQTGRWTGTGFQPLNMDKGFEDVNPDELVGNILMGDASWLDLLYGDAMTAVGRAARHWVQAEPGKKLIAGDFVSIEAVLLSCLAGEQWKIDAFARGDKMYELMADKIYKLPPGTVTKATHPKERFDGKTGELAFGYQGALGAWLKFDNSGRHTDERIIEICKAWREQHPMIVMFWKGLEGAAMQAMLQGEASYRDITYKRIDRWLACILPNGKHIWYADPELREARPQWHQPHQKEECAEGTCDCGHRAQLTYMAQKEGQWRRVYTYGGKLAENVTQAVSREVLIPAMLRLKKYGYHIILSVYDEIVCEEDLNFGSAKELVEIMEDTQDAWCWGWPITADAWEGDRYKK